MHINFFLSFMENSLIKNLIMLHSREYEKHKLKETKSLECFMNFFWGCCFLDNILNNFFSLQLKS